MNVTTTINHLGGMRALRLMIGAYAFTAGKDRLTFAFKGSKQANKAAVILAPDDTYTLKFYRVRKGQAVEVASAEGIYAEELRGRFESMTGLYLVVPRSVSQ